jgi:hypothetical protein
MAPRYYGTEVYRGTEVVTAHLSPHRMQAPIYLLAVVTASLCEVRWASPTFFCNMGALMPVINHVTEKPGIYQAMLYMV